MVRIRETRSPETTFLPGENDPSLLRLRQDTVYIPPAEKGDRFSRLTVVINRYGDLGSRIATGINAKKEELEVNKERRWAGDWKPGAGHPAYLTKDPSITMKKDTIYQKPGINDCPEITSIFSL
ncbi:MAG TPA: hypothetical protein VHE34_18635 [Puia sp.]|uniref:hypothetical protein n=1 Tax=Puia sp. TaxID=2045100 RepID=UPI002CD852BE|nr:hypothetical protein [Puia sp.]HVU97257.1 hypothetical protein [Puia sp.]